MTLTQYTWSKNSNTYRPIVHVTLTTHTQCSNMNIHTQFIGLKIATHTESDKGQHVTKHRQVRTVVPEILDLMTLLLMNLMQNA